jgi:hypothetical protein
MVTSLPDRLFLVIIIFLYSASLTCAMAQCTPPSLNPFKHSLQLTATDACSHPTPKS